MDCFHFELELAAGFLVFPVPPTFTLADTAASISFSCHEVTSYMHPWVESLSSVASVWSAKLEFHGHCAQHDLRLDLLIGAPKREALRHRMEALVENVDGLAILLHCLPKMASFVITIYFGGSDRGVVSLPFRSPLTLSGLDGYESLPV